MPDASAPIFFIAQDSQASLDKRMDEMMQHKNAETAKNTNVGWNQEKAVLALLWMFTFLFLAGALLAGRWQDTWKGFWVINTSASQFTMDYFQLGGLGGTFFNTAVISLFCCLLFTFTHAQMTSLSMAAYWLNVGFGSFGMTVFSMWPFVLGVFVYSRIRKIAFGEVVNQALFATALAPFAAELMFRYPSSAVAEGSVVSAGHALTLPGFAAALLLGVAVGLVTPPLCAHAPAFHKGYDLYSAGPAMGFLAFLIYCLLYRVPGIPAPVNTDLGDGQRLYVTLFFTVMFLLVLLYAYRMDPACFRKYRSLWKSDGYKTDYLASFGIGASLVNFSFYGFFILLYYSLVHGFSLHGETLVLTGARFTGATMGAVMCMLAFALGGAQPRTVFPVMAGYVLASLIPLLVYLAGGTGTLSFGLTSQGILVGLCFASGLAPISGRFGFGAGVAAGALHAFLVTSVPLLHGGFCLYNGGFTAGIVCFLLVPVLECFHKSKG